MLLRSTLILLLGLALACGGEGDDDDDESDGDADTDIDTDTDADADPSCDADIALTFPDGSEARFGCEASTLAATYEFDPDGPPEIRTLDLRLSATSEEGFECYVDLAIDGVCGEQYYEVGYGAGVSVAAYDCAGVPDGYEGLYAITVGYADLETASAGEEVGSFSSVDTRVEGAIVGRGAGISIEGSFAIRDLVEATDAEEIECTGTLEEPSVPTDALDASGRLEFEFSEGFGFPPCTAELTMERTDSEAPPGRCPSCELAAVFDVTDLTHDCSASLDEESVLGTTVTVAVDTDGRHVYTVSGGEWSDLSTDGWDVIFSGSSATVFRREEEAWGATTTTYAFSW